MNRTRIPLAALSAALSAALLAAPALAQSGAPQAAPNPLSATEARHSIVSLPFLAPAGARDLVLAHALPEGAVYRPGSARLDGEPFSEPLRGPSGVLYWVLTAQTLAGVTDPRAGLSAATLQYDFEHAAPLEAPPAPALLARYPDGRSELLSGALDAADLARATPLRAAVVSENAGAIRLPLEGSVVRTRDRVDVVLELPQGEVPPLTVNGETVGTDRIGTEVQDGVRGVQRLTFVGVRLQPGANVLRLGDETVTVFLAGATERVEVEPLELVADGSTPLRLRLRALDASGLPTEQPTVTVRTNLELRTRDARPAEAGHQLALTGGEGVLELRPQAAPTVLLLDVLLGDTVVRHRLDVTPRQQRVGVGVVSVTVGLGGGAPEIAWQARASLETPVGAGQLYVAADRDGLPVPGTLGTRAPLYGDAAVVSVPLTGDDPVAALYAHPDFQVAYRRAPLPVDVLPVGETATALTVSTPGATRLSGFVAALPGERIFGVRLSPDGTRLLRLPPGVVPGSETLTVLTLERDSGQELARTPLVRGVDYVLEPRSGVVTLLRPLEPQDGALNTQEVLASYRLEGAAGARNLVYGAQLRHDVDETFRVGVAAVDMGGALTVGARADYDDGVTRGHVRAAWAGGIQAGAELSTRQANTTANFRVRYQSPGFHGVGAAAEGLFAGGRVTLRPDARVGVVLDGEYASTPAGERGLVSARVETRAAPFRVGVGASAAFGDRAGLGGVIAVGYQSGPLDIGVTHTRPLTGGIEATTDFTARYRVAEALTVGLRGRHTAERGLVAALTLDSTLGRTNYALAYEMPTAGGDGNRARFGVHTTLPLNERFSMDLRAQATQSFAGSPFEASGGADLRYRGAGLVAAVGSDLTVRGGEFGAVVRGGLSGRASDRLTLGADALAEFRVSGSGQRAALGYAYRGDALNSLGYLRLASGSLAPAGLAEATAGVSAEYRQPAWALRGGVDTRTLLNDPDSFTAQASLGGTAYLTERLGVGAWGRVLTQPATNTATLGFGVEGSLRVLSGTWLTAGYNLRGFEGLPGGALYTRPGLYLRLDLTVNETLLEERK